MSEPIGFDLLNNLYAHTIGVMPGLKDKPLFSVFGISFLSAYGITKGVQWSIKKISPNFYHSYLPIIEKELPKITVAVPLIYSIVDPQGAKEMIMTHPVYLAGIGGGIYGGCVAALEHSKKEMKNNGLETIIDNNKK
jgi:hypothetical protein